VTPLRYTLTVILIIDNYDSFTYNLVQRIGELGVHGPTGQPPEMHVVRNDKITADEALALNPERVIISPGPCSPREAGVSCEIATAFAGRVPLLGVCLGHQSIGHTFDMIVARHSILMHGKTSLVHHDGKGIFEGLSNPFTATRYHSLIVTMDSVDHDRFEVSAWCEEAQTGEKIVMGLRLKPGTLGDDLTAPLDGVQFHPESFLSTEGPRLLANFLGLPSPDLANFA